jgi:hypothetical protein
MIQARLLIVFILLAFSACKILESKPTVETILIEKADLLSIKDEVALKDEVFMQSNFFIKKVLHDDVLYLKANDLNHVIAYHFLDSSIVNYTYKPRPITVNEFSVGDESIYLFSEKSKLLIVLDHELHVKEEITFNPQKYDIESSMGESLFQWDERNQVFYVGMTQSKNAKGVELIGVFNRSGQLQFTFGNFKKDNQQAQPGYLLTNHGIRHQLTNTALYVLKKESSKLYQFNLSGELQDEIKLDFEKIPKAEKVKPAGKSIIKDQVMDFFVDEARKEIVYTYLTNTGEYMGEKGPERYIAFKKFKSDTVCYDQVDFIDVLSYQNRVISTIPIRSETETKYLVKYQIKRLED